MNNPSIMPNLGSLSSGNITSSSPPAMKEGQLFHGKINQLFPGEMAEIQIGSQKLHAKLEVPLKAGDSYYFQVKSTDPELQLKLISGPHAQGESQNVKIGNLLDTLQLPKTPEMRSLVNYFMKQQIPITKESLIASEALLKQTPVAQQQEALASIGKLVTLKLPVTPQLFQAMMGVETKANLQSVLNELQAALIGDKQLPNGQKQQLQSTLQQLNQPLLEASGGKLLAQTLVTALDKSAPPSDRFQAVQLLKAAGILPAQTSLANLPEVLAKLVSAPANATTQQTLAASTTGAQGQLPAAVEPSTSTMPKLPILQQMVTMLQQAPAGTTKLPAATANVLQQMIQQSDLPATVKTQLATAITAHQQSNEPASALLTKVSEVLFSETARQMLPATPNQGQPSTSQSVPTQQAPVPTVAQSTMPALLQSLVDAQGGQDKLAGLVRQAMQSTSPAIQSFLASAEAATANQVSGDTVKQAIQSVLAKLGVSYEAGLIARDPQIAQIQDALKPQLVALMQEGLVGSALRDAAESVVSRLNGQPLQSTENGNQQQIIMQVPLQMNGKQIDATLEWNGRMKENGKIDPDHARVLFYLDLETIKKTVVDMQVQNKVVTLTIFNEDPALKILGTMLEKKLESGLDTEGYRLSAVRFKPFREEVATSTSTHSSSKSDTQGVDFRI